MNELEFTALMVARNELASRLCAEVNKARSGEENEAAEALDSWYNFVHAVLYENDRKVSLFRGDNGSRGFSEQVHRQMNAFCKKDNPQVRRAFILWSAADNGDFAGQL